MAMLVVLLALNGGGATRRARWSTRLTVLTMATCVYETIAFATLLGTTWPRGGAAVPISVVTFSLTMFHARDFIDLVTLTVYVLSADLAPLVLVRMVATLSCGATRFGDGTVA